MQDIYQVVPWDQLAFDLGQDLDAEQVAFPRLFKSHLRLSSINRGVWCQKAFRRQSRGQIPLPRAPSGRCASELVAFPSTERRASSEDRKWFRQPLRGNESLRGITAPHLSLSSTRLSQGRKPLLLRGLCGREHALWCIALGHGLSFKLPSIWTWAREKSILYNIYYIKYMIFRYQKRIGGTNKKFVRISKGSASAWCSGPPGRPA